MKRSIYNTVLIGSILLYLAPVCAADTYVHGYTRKDGTYVAPHYRSDPDGDFSNNWSTVGNVNPYTGEEGTKTAPDSGGTGSYSSDASSLPTIPSEEERQKQLQQAADVIAKQQEQARQRVEEQTKENNEALQQQQEHNEALQQQQEQVQAQIAELQKKQEQINNEILSRSAPAAEVDTQNTDTTINGTEPFYGESGEEVDVPPVASTSTDSQSQTDDAVTNENASLSSDLQSQTDDESTSESDDSVTTEDDNSSSSKTSWWDRFLSFLKHLFD